MEERRGKKKLRILHHKAAAIVRKSKPRAVDMRRTEVSLRMHLRARAIAFT